MESKREQLIDAEFGIIQATGKISTNVKNILYLEDLEERKANLEKVREKGIKIADLGREGKEKVLLAEAVADDSEIYLAIEDEEGNMYHSASGEVPLESRMGKGKMLPSVGIVKSKGVYSFRLKGQK